VDPAKSAALDNYRYVQPSGQQEEPFQSFGVEERVGRAIRKQFGSGDATGTIVSRLEEHQGRVVGRLAGHPVQPVGFGCRVPKGFGPHTGSGVVEPPRKDQFLSGCPENPETVLVEVDEV